MQRFAVALAVLLLVAVVVVAQGRHDLTWAVVSGGGGYSDAYPGPEALVGGVVQPAGVMTGGGYELQSGLFANWRVEETAGVRWYLPLLVR